MRSVILIEVPFNRAELERHLAGLEQFITVEYVSSSEALLRQLEQETNIALVVIGANVTEPVRLAQRIHVLNKQIGLVIQCSGDTLEAIRRAVRFAPFLGADVICEDIPTAEALATRIADTVQRVEQRSNFQTVLNSVNARLQTAVVMQPLAAQFLNRILDFAPIGIVHTDRRGQILAWNRKAAQILEREERDALGSSLTDFFPESSHTVSTLLEHALAANQEAVDTVIERRSATSQQYLSLTVTRLTLTDQESSVIVLLQDITQRVLAEQARAELLQREQQARKEAEAERERFALLARAGMQLSSSLEFQPMLANLSRMLLSNLADCCVVDLVNDDGSIQRAATAARLDQKEVLLSEEQEFFPPNWHSRDPAAQALLEGESIFIPVLAGEMAGRSPESEHSGLIKALEPHSLIAVPMIVRNRVIGAITLTRTRNSSEGFTEDDLRLAQELAQRAALAVDNARLYAEVYDQRERLRVTLSSIGDAVIVTDNQGHIVFMNGVAEQVTGWTQAEALGQPLERVFRIINEHSRQPVKSPVVEVLRTGAIVGLANHTLLVRKDGSEVPIDDSGAPIFSEHRDIIGVVLVFRDVTERKQIERQREALLEQEQAARQAAEAANEQKLRFLSMISHELRTPLTSIKGFTTTLLAKDVEWEMAQYQEFLDIINLETDKLTDLVEHLLDVSRMHAGTLRLNPAPHSVHEIIDVARAQMYTLTSTHELALEIPGALPAIMVDRHRIAQVMVNLVNNAVKFSPPRSRITLRASANSDHVKIEVSDEGIGIPPEERERVFDAFQQGNHWPHQAGAGLGLAICKALVEAHGGRIWIEDHNRPGTTVAFTLPFAPRST